MTTEIRTILTQNGYLIQESPHQLLMRKKLLTSWKMFLHLFLPGLILFVMVMVFKNRIQPFLLIFCLSTSIVLMVIPFFQYFTSAYRSLLIDFDNQSLLFRSAVSRAYRFFEIVDIHLEIVSRKENIEMISKVTEQRYVISILFSNGSKEELMSLVFDENQNESAIFKIKDYFQVLLSQHSRN